MSTCFLNVLLFNFQFVFLIAPENIYMSCGAIKNNRCFRHVNQMAYTKNVLYVWNVPSHGAQTKYKIIETYWDVLHYREFGCQRFSCSSQHDKASIYTTNPKNDG